MGFGDEIMSTGFARGAADRGKRIAFGDGRKIIWGPWSEQMFRHNPNIARPGEELASNIEWIAHYKGCRLYNSVDRARTRWIWNFTFRPVPGELFFDDAEKRFAESVPHGFILIEPNVPAFKSVAPNKTWPFERYEEVARSLLQAGHDVRQFSYGPGRRLSSARAIETPSFRHALAALSRAALYIGPEGGLHHGAAAVSVPGVVIFGGFIPPEVTGYPTHTNLTGGAAACGSLQPCGHCRAALDAISVDDVLTAAAGHLERVVA